MHSLKDITIYVLMFEIDTKLWKAEHGQNRLSNAVNFRPKVSSPVVRWTMQQIVGWDCARNWFPKNKTFLAAVLSWIN